MILQREISKRALLDGVPEKTVEKDYVIHWFMSALGRSKVSNSLMFKGGTALRVCYVKEYRYSEDIDLTATTPIRAQDFVRQIRSIADWIHKGCGVRIEFETGSLEEKIDRIGLSLTYVGPLGANVGKRAFKLEISTSESIQFDPKRCHIMQNYSDIPRNSTATCYSLEEIACEKFRCLLNPSRKQPRDVYDLWYLLSNSLFELSDLSPAFAAKSRFKKFEPQNILAAFAKKEKALELLWRVRLEHQIKSIPKFKECFKEVKRAVKELHSLI